jgi:hypothetical protein
MWSPRDCQHSLPARGPPATKGLLGVHGHSSARRCWPRQAPVCHHRSWDAVPATVPVRHEEDRHHRGRGQGPSALLERQAGTRIPDLSCVVAAGLGGLYAESNPTSARPVRGMVQRTSRAQRLAWTDTARSMARPRPIGAGSDPGSRPTPAADRSSPKALPRRPAIAGHRDLGEAGGMACNLVRLSRTRRWRCAPTSAHEFTEARINSALARRGRIGRRSVGARSSFRRRTAGWTIGWAATGSPVA